MQGVITQNGTGDLDGQFFTFTFSGTAWVFTGEEQDGTGGVLSRCSSGRRTLGTVGKDIRSKSVGGLDDDSAKRVCQVSARPGGVCTISCVTTNAQVPTILLRVCISIVMRRLL